MRAVVFAAFAAGCSGSQTGPVAPTATQLACPGAPAAIADHGVVFGVVVDRDHRPLAGVAIQASSWQDHGAGGGWHPTIGHAPRTSTDGAGRYELATPPGGFQLEATIEGHTATGVGYRADAGAVRHVDIVIDTTRSATVFDAAVHDEASAIAPCAWSCPSSHPPAREWWLDDRPCPDGAALAIELDHDHGVASIRCRTTAGIAHGAFSAWVPSSESEWVMTSGWYVDGRECWTWRDPAEVPAPASLQP